MGDSKDEIVFDVNHIYEHIDVQNWKTRPIMMEKCRNLRNEIQTRWGDSVNLLSGATEQIKAAAHISVAFVFLPANFLKCRLHFLNETEETQQVGLATTFPAKIVPIDLSKCLGQICGQLPSSQRGN